MDCPRCRGVMETLDLEGHLGRQVAIDLCDGCQYIWFDGKESLQLAPGSTLRLFRRIGERTGPPAPAPERATCPRCSAGLRRTQDMQRSTRFEYLACPDRHGRLINFFNFLREKDFVRPLSPAQVAKLRAQIDSVNCSNCGAPIDLARSSACGQCGSPLSMLDLSRAESLIETLQKADAGSRSVDPALPLQLEHARRQVHAGFDAFERDADWTRDVTASGLVGAGLHALARWLR